MDNTKDYKSPITLYFQTMQAEAVNRAKKLDQDIYEAILHYGVVVDRDELIKALAYDRDQYALGFANGFDKGKESAVVHAHWEKDPITKWMSCSNCGGDPPITKYINADGDPYESNFCPYCGALMDENHIAEDGKKGIKIPVISMEDVTKIMEEMEK